MGESDDFEWDDMKDAENRRLRGLPLPLAARLFDGRLRLDSPSRKSPPEEPRFETMAEYEGHVLFCTWTWRGERRRIISLRVAHRSERRAYQKAIEGSRSFGEDD